MGWYPAVKELVQDANFECNEGGIVSNYAILCFNFEVHDLTCCRTCKRWITPTSLSSPSSCTPTVSRSTVATVQSPSELTSDRLPRCLNVQRMTTSARSRQLMMVTSSASNMKQAVRLPFSSPQKGSPLISSRNAGGDRVAEYDMKLMDIDADTLGIPDTDYDARITMLAAEFTRIVRDLHSLGESVRIEVSKEGVRFASDGEAAQGNILLKQTDAARERYENYGKDDDDQVEEVKDEEDEEKPKKVKKEKVKKEEGVEDEDAEMASGDDDEAEFKAKSEDEGEEEASDSEKKKRKRPAASSSVRSPCSPYTYLLSGLSSSHRTRRQKRRRRKWLMTRAKVAAVGCISR